MSTDPYSYVHFFDTLRDMIGEGPYAILQMEEVNRLLTKIDSLAKDFMEEYAALEQVNALRRAIDNAQSDGYFPLVVLPARKFQAAMSLLGMT